MEPRETVRLNFSFLFADTAEGALSGLFLLAQFCDTRANTYSRSPSLPM